ncbi:MAG: methylmalonyl Co-A mutase-associated GTPase MeaB, partial [Deltaproteobacteria bacterium]|nr:methylmalonyl Co-A mutase-associated GTPase MeaB [Deltaproteobacteria bacterium]
QVQFKECMTGTEEGRKFYVIGVTGLPGAGKSSLIDVMINYFRSNKKTVGVIAIDPTSPFTGGSILGDRVRMQNHSSDRDVFIKSLPTRGWRGGISKVTSRMVTVMDAMKKDIIIVETAGVGQTEVEIKNLVHTTIVVLVGGLGDYIQIVKAGILEIADIFVINKADNSNTGQLEFDLKTFFGISENTSQPGEGETWKPHIYLTEAINDRGISKLIEGIFHHEKYLKSTGKFEQYFKNKSRIDLRDIISDYLINLFFAKLEEDDLHKKLLDDLEANKIDPYSLAEKILKEFLKLNSK